MRRAPRPASALAAALALLAAPAGAAPTCMTQAQADSLARFATPLLVDAAVERCRTALPAGAFLPREGAAMAARYRSALVEPPEQAVAAFERLGGGDPMPDGISPETMGGIIRDVLRDMIGKEVKAADCPAINEVMETLAPLPPANTAKLAMLFLKLGSKNDPKFRICGPGESR